MNLFIWTDALATGNSFIDEDHRELVRRVNAVLEAIALKNGDVGLDHCMLQLRDYARHHFSHEELEMRLVEYELSADHQQAHAKLLEQLEEVHAGLVRGEGCEPMVLYRFLTWWVKDHIREWDTPLAVALADKNLR